MTDDRHTAAVRALVSDLLPVLAPGADIDDEGVVSMPAGDDVRARVSTEPLVRECAGRPHQEWPQLVDRWIGDVRARAAGMAGGDGADGSAGDLPRDALRMRIMPRLDEAMGAAAVTMPFGRYFDAVLTLDLPDRVELVSRARIGDANPGDLLTAALGNTVAQELVHCEARDHEVTPTHSVRLVAKDGSPYVSTAVTSVERFLAGPAPYGVLLAVPAYSAMLLHPVASEAVFDFAASFFSLADSMHADAADPCSPLVFWWHEREFHLISLTAPAERAERPRLDLPPELRPVVESLPPG
ncbi:MAG: hypothetical protein GEV10_25255 [Streptosporangiales bacterium]|nr:hypothetical protein [Streptosporangiales bacterium]